MEFVGPCKRCMIITVDPDNAKRDASLHKTVIKENNNKFGVYASVIKKGDIHVDNDIHLLD
ncbi:MOSC domain protein [Halalkalibacter krulwichiae]|uniref:MOSC domain protein n=2 Tax=Halalkalibacter krulwichiae TaxID=199441 RepID=A0A1X9MMW3_9BACI|nr:MOSC domain-containing protein [Halalkalibacter krulwichiae]ARK32612.1 MOSC domain protein [Halalkalibacter krulwichiae]